MEWDFGKNAFHCSTRSRKCQDSHPFLPVPGLGWRVRSNSEAQRATSCNLSDTSKDDEQKRGKKVSIWRDPSGIFHWNPMVRRVLVPVSLRATSPWDPGTLVPGRKHLASPWERRKCPRLKPHWAATNDPRQWISTGQKQSDMDHNNSWYMLKYVEICWFWENLIFIFQLFPSTQRTSYLLSLRVSLPLSLSRSLWKFPKTGRTPKSPWVLIYTKSWSSTTGTIWGYPPDTTGTRGEPGRSLRGVDPASSVSVGETTGFGGSILVIHSLSRGIYVHGNLHEHSHSFFFWYLFFREMRYDDIQKCSGK